MIDLNSFRALTILLFLFSVCPHSQAQRFGWAKNFQTRSTTDFSPFGNSVSVGINGEVFLGGYYVKNLDVDGITLDAGDRQDGFVVKLDSKGQVLSAKSLETSAGGSVDFIRADNNGDLVIIGGFLGTIRLGHDTLMTNASPGAYFVAKCTKAGEFLWAKKFEANVTCPTLDVHGNIYFINAVPYSSLGLLNETLIKLDGSGNVIYSSLIYHRTPTSYFGSEAIAVDPFGNVYIAGFGANPTLIGDINVDANETGTNLIVKCNRNGVPKRIKQVSDIPSSGDRLSGQMITDGVGSLYHVDRANKLSITKYDSAGTILWSLRNDQSNIHMSRLQLDELGNLYVAGAFQGNFAIGKENFSSVDQGIFVAKFNNTGAIQWKLQGENEYLDYVMDMSRDSTSGDIYVAGIMQSLAPSFGETVLQSSSLDTDVLIIQVKDNVVPGALSINLGNDTTLCAEETLRLYAPGFALWTWQDGSHSSTFYATAPGKYYVTAVDYLGRQYSDTLNITACVNSEMPEHPIDPEAPQVPETPDLPGLTFPNVITPNNDAYNEFFVVGNLDVSNSNSLTVLDRWGKTIFSTNDYQNNWDGWQLQSGVYFYEFVDGRNQKLYKGWLHIIK